MKPQSGFALLLTIFLLLFISLLFVAVFNLLITDIDITGNQKKDTEALYIAEAGIEDAIHNLRQDKDWTSLGSTPVEFPSGSGNNYTVTYPIDSDIISSIATLSDGYSKRIEVGVSVTGTSPPYEVNVNSWSEK